MLRLVKWEYISQKSVGPQKLFSIVVNGVCCDCCTPGKTSRSEFRIASLTYPERVSFSYAGLSAEYLSQSLMCREEKARGNVYKVRFCLSINFGLDFAVDLISAVKSKALIGNILVDRPYHANHFPSNSRCGVVAAL